MVCRTKMYSSGLEGEFQYALAGPMPCVARITVFDFPFVFLDEQEDAASS